LPSIDEDNLEDLLPQIWRDENMWSDPNITVSFPSALPQHWLDQGVTADLFTAFDAADRAAFWQAISLWADVADISLTNLGVGDTGEIRGFGVAAPDAPWGAKVGSSPGFDVNMDVQVNTQADDGNGGTIDWTADMSPNSTGFYILIHEIGHTLGLDHPGSYDAGADIFDGVDFEDWYETAAEYVEDSLQYTVMSYFKETETGAQYDGAVDTPLLHDIYTIQQIYGANYTTRDGNTTYGYNAAGLTDSNDPRLIAAASAIYDFDNNTYPVMCIWDAGGFDTLDLSGSDQTAEIDLRPGEFSSTHGQTYNISIAYNPDPLGQPNLDHFIEAAIGGSAGDTIGGNHKANSLEGGGGDDTLDGRDGDDTLRGDANDDWLYGGEGLDSLWGGTGTDQLSGNEGNDTLRGEAGTDWLIGQDGMDTAYGGGENDYIYGDDDAATAFGAGLLQEFANNAGYGDILFGEDGHDSIYGGFGADAISGGLGDDFMEGGWGQDAFDGGAGSDTVTYAYSILDWDIDLTTGVAAINGVSADNLASVENLVMGTGDDTVMGSSADNTIEGGDGDDHLAGGGGHDTLMGGNQSDVLQGGAGRDVMNGGGGTDLVDYAGAGEGVSVDLMLGGSQFISAGEAFDTLVAIEEVVGSNGFDDTLRGNGGVNSLYGLGGNDLIEGRGGNDLIDGGMGIDTASYESAPYSVIVSLLSTGPQNTVSAGIDTLIAIDNLIGSAFSDTLTGNGQVNVLDGLAGNDGLIGGDGDDELIGGAGIDHLEGGNGEDLLEGGSHDDWLEGDGNDDVLRGGIGDDTLDGGAGRDIADYVDATSGVTVDLAIAGAQAVGGGQGSDTLIGVEEAVGSNGFDDALSGNGGINRLFGLAGNDVLEGRGGNDFLDGGMGLDTASYASAAAGVTVNLAILGAQNTTSAGLDTLISIDNLTGSAHDDALVGDVQANVLRGLTGEDILTGGGGADTLDGGAGADAMLGGLGNDTFVVADIGDVFTEAVDEGIDQVDTSLASLSLYSVANVERIVYTGAGNFVGRGNGLDNRIQGASGNDRFVTDQGGADRYFGDLGVTDQVDFRLSATGAIVNLTTGVHGGAATGDFFSSIEYFYGSDIAGDDLTGAAFNDHLFGYAGGDTLSGLGGSDYLYGGEGDDEISGGALIDFLYGENGADDFNYTALTDSAANSGARDRIYDFVAGVDDIDVSAIDASTAGGGNEAFTQFLGSGAFTAEGQVRWYQSGVNTVIEFNTTGASGAEMQIQLQNFTAANLAASDFIG
jgi:Ca2+-binding RTX toxin-like protein